VTKPEARAILGAASVADHLPLREMGRVCIALAVMFPAIQAELDSLRFRVEELESQRQDITLEGSECEPPHRIRR
jgi:hypothetical protein